MVADGENVRIALLLLGFPGMTPTSFVLPQNSGFWTAVLLDVSRKGQK